MEWFDVMLVIIKCILSGKIFVTAAKSMSHRVERAAAGRALR